MELWRILVQVVGLVSVIAVSGRVSAFGLPEVIGLTLLAISIPQIGADGWQEFVHEPRFSEKAVSLAAFVATTLARTALLGGTLLIADQTLAAVEDSAPLVALIALAAACLPVVSMVIGPRVVLAVHRAETVPVSHLRGRRIAELARTYGLSAPRLVELDASSFEGVNAFATGTGARVTIAVSEQLLAGPAQLFDHVVSHELAHIARKHLRWSVAAASLAAGSVVGLSIVVAVSFFSPPELIAVFVLVLAVSSVPFRWLLAWLSRVNERQADLDALARAAVDARSVRLLHVSGRALLEPRLFARLASAHPSPAERLELVARSEPRSGR